MAKSIVGIKNAGRCAMIVSKPPFMNMSCGALSKSMKYLATLLLDFGGVRSFCDQQDLQANRIFE